MPLFSMNNYDESACAMRSLCSELVVFRCAVADNMRLTIQLSLLLAAWRQCDARGGESLRAAAQRRSVAHGGLYAWQYAHAHSAPPRAYLALPLHAPVQIVRVLSTSPRLPQLYYASPYADYRRHHYKYRRYKKKPLKKRRPLITTIRIRKYPPSDDR